MYHVILAIITVVGIVGLAIIIDKALGMFNVDE